MKNIQAQYQALLEGKMSKANFVRNVRMQFPQYISPVTSLDDSIRILKGKRILSESHEANDKWYDEFGQAVERLIGQQYNKEIDRRDARSKVQKALDGENIIATYGDYKAEEAAKRFLKGKGILKVSESHEANEIWMAGFDAELENIMDRLHDSEKELVKQELEYTTGGDLISKYEGMTPNEAAYDFVYADVLGLVDPDQAKEDEKIDHLRKGSKELEELNEAEKKTPSIDHVDYIQLTRGTEFELSKMRVLSDENYLKAKERAYKKLVKNPNAYRHLIVANYAEVEKKDKVLKPQEVKKGELSDKPNQMKTLKKDATPNTKDNLGKKEKRKGMPDGVKQLKEEMMREFGGDAIPEIKRKFAAGHEVVTPEGKTGQIEELTQDNTATVKFEDGTKGDYQANVLKTVDEDRSEREVGQDELEPSPAFLKFSREKDAEERAAKRAAEEHKGIKIGSKVKVDAAAAKDLKLDATQDYTVKDFITTNKGKITQSVDAVLDNGKRVEVGNLQLVDKGDDSKLEELKKKLVKAVKEAGERTAFVTTTGGETTAMDYKNPTQPRKVADNSDVTSVVLGTGQKLK